MEQTPQSETALIVVRQLPIIDEELRKAKESIERDVALALSLPCNDKDTKIEVKRVRAKLKKLYDSYEEQRIAVKNAINAPYDALEAVYKECIRIPLTESDAALAKKIAAVEDEEKLRTSESVELFFNELIEAADEDVSFLTFNRIGLKVGLSDSLKSLKDEVRTFVGKAVDAIKLIATQDHAEEIMVEYKTSLNVENAIVTVKNRHKSIEAEKARQAAAEAARQEQLLKVQNVVNTARSNVAIGIGAKIVFPTEVEREEAKSVKDSLATEAEFTVKLRVTAEKGKLIALRNFLEEGKYRYEQYAD